MSGKPPSVTGALRNLLDDLVAAVIGAPDAEILDEAQGPWIKGYAAEQVRAVLRAALRGERLPAVPPPSAIGGTRIEPRRQIRLPAARPLPPSTPRQGRGRDKR